MATEAQIKASVKHNRTKDSITIRPDKEKGTEIRKAAEKIGVSVTQYILNAIEKYMVVD